MDTFETSSSRHTYPASSTHTVSRTHTLTNRMLTRPHSPLTHMLACGIHHCSHDSKSPAFLIEGIDHSISRLNSFHTFYVTTIEKKIVYPKIFIDSCDMVTRTSIEIHDPSYYLLSSILEQPMHFSTGSSQQTSDCIDRKKSQLQLHIQQIRS